MCLGGGAAAVIYSLVCTVAALVGFSSGRPDGVVD